jgi:hypothetical protein
MSLGSGGWLESNLGESAVWVMLDAADKSTGTEEVLRVELVFDFAHQVKGVARVSPNIEGLLEFCGCFQDSEEATLGLAEIAELEQGWGGEMGEAEGA